MLLVSKVCLFDSKYVYSTSSMFVRKYVNNPKYVYSTLSKFVSKSNDVNGTKYVDGTKYINVLSMLVLT